MRKPVQIALTVLLIAFAGVIAWQVLRLREPVYQGKRLSVWLQGYHFPMLVPETDEAVRRIGTKGIPFLLRMLRAKDNALLRKFSAFTKRQPAFVRLAQRYPFLSINYTSAETQHLRAEHAFRALGVNAKDAVPELIEIYQQAVSASSQWPPASALGAAGLGAEKAIPLLLHRAADTNEGVREIAIDVLGEIHSKPELVVPVLIKCMNDPASAVRFKALFAFGYYREEATAAVPALLGNLKYPNSDRRLYMATIFGRIHAESSLVVPALMELLQDSEPLFRADVAEALAGFGADAKDALPAMVHLLDDKEENVRVAATNALKAIDPDAAAKAGVR